jgi:hypothetical protein
MEYKYPIETFKFNPSVINTPQWITLDLGKEFEIRVFDDVDMPGYIFLALVLPEKIDRDDGGIFMQEFYNRFYMASGSGTYSIPKEEIELSQLPELANFYVKHIGDARKRKYVESCGIYLKLETSTFHGCAPLEYDDRIFNFNIDLYLKSANDESEIAKTKFVENKMEDLTNLDIEIMRDQKTKD